MSTDKWMDTEDMVGISKAILLSHKKEWNNAICSNMMDIEIIALNQKEENKYQNLSLSSNKWYHLYVEYKIWHKWTYLQKRNR